MLKSEEVLQKQVVEWFNIQYSARNYIVNSNTNESLIAVDGDKLRAAKYYNKRRAMGMTKGFPDLSFYVANGVVFHVELKSNVGRVAPAQKECHKKLEANGHKVYICRDFNDVRNVIEMQIAQSILNKSPA